MGVYHVASFQCDQLLTGLRLVHVLVENKGVVDMRVGEDAQMTALLVYVL